MIENQWTGLLAGTVRRAGARPPVTGEAMAAVVASDARRTRGRRTTRFFATLVVVATVLVSIVLFPVHAQTAGASSAGCGFQFGKQWTGAGLSATYRPRAGTSVNASHIPKPPYVASVNWKQYCLAGQS